VKLGDKIPIEELDELRLARVERAVVDEARLIAAQGRPSSPSQGGRAAWAVATIAVAVALFFVWRQQRSSSTAVQPIASTAQATDVSTGPGQSTTLRLGDAVVEVGENAKLVVERYGDGRIVVELAHGRVHCDVEPRPGRPTFQVLSDDVRVTVIGTAFAVDRSDTVQVQVERGTVSVRTSSEDLRLHAGDAWEGSPYARVALAEILRARELDTPPTPSDDDSVRHRDGGPGRKHHPGSGSGGHHPTHDGGPHRHRDGEHRQARAPLKASELLRDAKPIRPIFPTSASPELARLKKVTSANPRRAVRELLSLAAKSSGREASFALYARAYLLFFELGQNHETVRAAQQYERRFPRGAEAEDMLWLRVRASCKAKDYTTCRAAAHTYLRRYPDGIFHGLASRIIIVTSAQ
jgi:hypothetical protein